jgi:type IV secretion system protein VirB10
MKSSSTFVAVQARLIAAFMVFSVLASQTAFAAGPQAAAPVPEQTSSSQTITVPAGTVIPMTLLSQIKSKSTKVGDTVRAQVAFPITAGTQIAIPAGTYVEGTVTSLTAQVKKTGQPDVQIHFTRLLYANGYTASLDALNTQASNRMPGSVLPAVASGAAGGNGFGAGRTRTAFYGGEGFAPRAQTGTQPTLPPLPSVGPSKAVIFGTLGGVVVALVTLGLLVRHSTKNTDYLLFDAGWQFQMTISTPLSVDAGQVVAAAATPSH